MPYIIAAIGGMLLNIVGSLIGRALVALGVGVATYTGVSSLLEHASEYAIGAFHSLPPEALQILAVLRVGEFISIITSAVAARLLLSGLQSGTFKRFVKL